MKTLVHKTTPKRIFYADNVNMNWSFDSLAALATKLLGAELELGDILICDNHRKDKRKMLQMTSKGFMIYYGRGELDSFVPLLPNNGQVRRLNKEIL